MSQIRVLLAEDHTLVRKGLRSLLDAEPGLEVIGEAEDGREAVELARQLAPDIVLMDISMPRLNGLEATRRIVQGASAPRVIVLTMHAVEEYALQALEAGAAGYLLKQAAVNELIQAIQTVQRGETYLGTAITRAALEAYARLASPPVRSPARLTGREREVLQLVAEGCTNRKIAVQLRITVKTVEAHRAHILEKIGARSTAELVRYAVRTGLVSL